MKLPALCGALFYLRKRACPRHVLCIHSCISRNNPLLSLSISRHVLCSPVRALVWARARVGVGFSTSIVMRCLMPRFMTTAEGYLVAGLMDGRVLAWEAKRAEKAPTEILSLEAHEGAVTSLSFPKQVRFFSQMQS